MHVYVVDLSSSVSPLCGFWFYCFMFIVLVLVLFIILANAHVYFTLF